MMDKSVDSNRQKFDIWLFATDLVNFMFLQSSKLPLDVVQSRFPGFTCKEFSQNLQTAILLIRDAVKGEVDEDFAGFQQRKDLNPEAYKKYAKELSNVHFCQGFEAENFLYYCVYVAFMAYRFYHGGVRKAQILAVFSVAGNKDCGLNYNLWADLDGIAKNIVGKTTTPHRSQLRGIAAKCVDYFTTPKIFYRTAGSNSGVPLGRRAADDSSKCSSEDLRLSTHITKVLLSKPCRRMSYKANTKNHEAMSCLHESLESSLEQLSISSALPLKVTKDGYTSNSTPLESSIEWKHGTLKRIALRNSFRKQILKLSPINSFKSLSMDFS